MSHGPGNELQGREMAGRSNAKFTNTSTEIVTEHLRTNSQDNFRNNLTLAESAVRCAWEAATDADAYAFLVTAVEILHTERNRLDEHLRKAKT